MKKIVITFTLYLLSSVLIAADLPDSLDYFHQKNDAVGRSFTTHDPSVIAIRLESGETLRAKYADIDFETLWSWEKESEKIGGKREFIISYRDKEGFLVTDVATSAVFALDGVIEPHPIDVALEECRGLYSTTLGMSHCKQLALKAWDFELNRGYQALGGSENDELKHSQRAWIKFRDAQTKYLGTEYGSRQGTIWQLVYWDHVIDLTKSQANRLKRIAEW